MDNGPMYDAFIKDNQQPESEPAQETPRISEADIPEFEIEVEEPLEDIEVSEIHSIDEPEIDINIDFNQPDDDVNYQMPVIPTSTVPAGLDAPAAFETPVFEEGVAPNVPVEGFEEYRTNPVEDYQGQQVGPAEGVDRFLYDAAFESNPEVVQQAVDKQVTTSAFDNRVQFMPSNNQAEFVDFRREPEDFRKIPQNDDSVVGTEGLLTAPPFEFEGGGVILPKPEVFNAYPPEVQRKIMEWTDRDIKARRDDESRRQDAVLRANITRDKNKMIVPICLIVLCVLCAAITGVITRNFLFVFAFLAVAIVIIIVMLINKSDSGSSNTPPPSQYTMR